MPAIIRRDEPRRERERTGHVHDGFDSALRKVWGVTLANGEDLPRRLLDRGNKTIWITGRSLGGALAELCAAQAVFVSQIPVQGVYTFGQPRVGNNDFARAVDATLGSRIFRFVNTATSCPECRCSRWASVITAGSTPSITPARPAVPSPPWRR
jgi:hypothetical protein